MISSFCLPPELQVEIVDYLHPKDLANVARLCQSWSEIALDALWSQQPISIWLLIELLMNPVDPNLPKGDQSHWHRLLRLTRRVLILTDRIGTCAEDMTILPIFELQLTTLDPIFPKLIGIDLDLTPVMRRIDPSILVRCPVFFPPSLSEMHLRNSKPMSTYTLSDILGPLAGKLPELRFWGLRGILWAQEYTTILHFLTSLPSLAAVELPEGMESMLPSLSELPGFVDMRVKFPADYSTELTPGAFKHLYNLLVQAESDFGSVGNLVAAVQPGQLKYMSIEYDPPELDDMTDTDASHRPFSELSEALSLHFASLVSLRLRLIEPDYSRLSFFSAEELLPLKDLVNLEELLIATCGHQLRIDDEDVDELTQGMTQLRILDLNGATEKSPHTDIAASIGIIPTLTRTSLYILATNCPLLEDLAVRLDLVEGDSGGTDPRDVLGEWTRFSKRFDNLRFLNIMQSKVIPHPTGDECDVGMVFTTLIMALAALVPPTVCLRRDDQRDEDEVEEEEKRFWRRLPKGILKKRIALREMNAKPPAGQTLLTEWPIVKELEPKFYAYYGDEK